MHIIRGKKELTIQADVNCTERFLKTESIQKSDTVPLSTLLSLLLPQLSVEYNNSAHIMFLFFSKVPHDHRSVSFEILNG